MHPSDDADEAAGSADGIVHTLPDDLRAALAADTPLFLRWRSLTPLGRNEFLCWIEEAKQATTRQRRIDRTCGAIAQGRTRPCCWPGCIHRTDKPPSRWQQAVLLEGRKR